MVNEMKNPSSLRIKLDLGMVDGKTKVKSKTFYLSASPLQALRVFCSKDTIVIGPTPPGTGVI